MVQPWDLEDIKYRQVDEEKVYLNPSHIELLDQLVASYFEDSKKSQNPSDKHLGRNVLLLGETGTGKSFVVGKVSDSCLRLAHPLTCPRTPSR